MLGTVQRERLRTVPFLRVAYMNPSLRLRLSLRRRCGLPGCPQASEQRLGQGRGRGAGRDLRKPPRMRLCGSVRHGEPRSQIDDLGLFTFPQVDELAGDSLLAYALAKITFGGKGTVWDNGTMIQTWEQSDRRARGEPINKVYRPINVDSETRAIFDELVIDLVTKYRRRFTSTEAVQELIRLCREALDETVVSSHE